MMNMLTSRPLSAALIVCAAAIVPSAAFAQDAMYMENASNAIGGLVIWLLPIGGIFAVVAMFASDKGAQAGRNSTTRR